MKVTRESRRQVRIQNAVFVVLFVGIIGLLAWLTHQYKLEADWTAGNRNTLTEATQKLLEGIQSPIRFTAFVEDDQELHQRIKARIDQYRRIKSDVSLEFVNPDLDPQRAREAGIARAGQILIQVGARSERVDDLREQTIATALQRLSRSGERYIAFLEGHDERDPSDGSNQGMRRLAEVLRRAGFNVQRLNLIRSPQIPDNTRVLVVASPTRDLLPGEVQVIRDYLAKGGNLLWLQDPGSLHGLEPLAEDLGLEFVPGTIVDANAELRAVLGIQHPAVIPVIDYRRHPVTEGLRTQTIFPLAWGVKTTGGEGQWTGQPLLVTLPRTWSETGSLDGEILYQPDEGDTIGPLNVGIALTRPVPEPEDHEAEAADQPEAQGAADQAEETTSAEESEAQQDAPRREQRVAVIGDSDFLSNAYVGAGANLDLGNNLFNWLSQDDQLIAIRPKSAPDTNLELSNTAIMVIGAGFLLALPLGLLVAGVGVWLRRRKR